MRYFRITSTSLAAACALAIFAADEVRADEPSEPIEVTVRGSAAPAFVSRVSADDREREPIDAASMLAELPSVHVRRLGADGAFSVLSIRGSASTQVGVMLGGIPLSSGADPSFDVGSIPLWPGASFRVYRGFAPATLGTTGYLGGLLVIEPPSSLSGTRTESQIVAGSFGALKARAGDVRAVGPVKLGVGVFGSRSDGDFSYDLPNPRSGGLDTFTRANAEAVSAGAIGRAALERSWGTVGVTFLGDARHVGLPGLAFPQTKYPSLDTSRFVAGADTTVRVGASASLRAQVWGRNERTRFVDPRHELDPVRMSDFAEQSILAAGGSVGLRGLRLGPVSIAVQVDGRGERLLPSAGVSTLGGIDASRIAGGAAVEAEARAGKALRLFASGRVDARRDDATGALLGGGVSTDVIPSGHVGASYRVSEAAVISAHLGMLRRLPSFAELYGDRGSLIGDPRLRIERGYSADLGVQGDVRTGGVSFGYEVAGFVTDARDLILFLPLGRSTFRASNVGAALLAGAEGSARLVTKNLVTSLSYTFLFTENQSDDFLAYGRPLPGRPIHDFSYDAAYRIGPVRLRYGIDAVAGTTVDTAATIVVPARIFHGAGLSLDVPRVSSRFSSLRIGLEVQNLFDVRVMRVYSPGARDFVAVPVSDFLGFPLPGRSFWATLRFRAP